MLNIDDINVIVEQNVSQTFNSGDPLIIDFKDSIYGKGFTVDNGCSCNG